MIPHPGLFNIPRYEKRDTEKLVSEMCNCPPCDTVHSEVVSRTLGCDGSDSNKGILNAVFPFDL